jgi:hypothetical protein
LHVFHLVFLQITEDIKIELSLCQKLPVFADVFGWSHFFEVLSQISRIGVLEPVSLKFKVFSLFTP